MYRFLLSRRWLVFHLVAVLLIPSFIQLGIWQYHRHEQRVARNELLSANLEATPLPVAELAGDGEVADGERWRSVTATGRYDREHEVVARHRTDADGDVGFYVITPLVLSDGSAVLVNRGWVDSPADPTAHPEVPAAPEGEVTVTGRLRQSETQANSGIRDRSGLPERQVMRINSDELGADLPYPLLTGYVEAVSTDPEPAESPAPVEEPDHTGIGSHFAYAIQWWMFAAGVPIGWFVLIRREARERAGGGRNADGGPARAPGPPAPTGPSPRSSAGDSPRPTAPAEGPAGEPPRPAALSAPRGDAG
ncbi:SURF1 family cytochrome oxidase biogenesis protein [Allostreptomyces psammosilenae]|uniref:SURF1-like protein n=1 Tax=Allostreptomyces psammosilenae TaxID=1892865 RepID=A0A852ZYY2_9ACTN|nr:SURF1 family protein [Allostreptomyces psammosilenae]NYI03318.1 cytochrome oxidase assembly protein ShyY1 [Allostreptomyces psammosilenae]